MRAGAIFAVIVVVGLIGIEVGLRATDHTASANVPAPLTHAQLDRSANAACARFNRAATKLSKQPKPKGLKMFTRRIRIEISLARRVTVALDGLIPPRWDAAAYDRLLRINAAGLRIVDGWAHDLETGQIRQAVLRVRGERRTLNVMNRRANKLARQLGFPACAKNVS